MRLETAFAEAAERAVTMERGTHGPSANGRLYTLMARHGPDCWTEVAPPAASARDDTEVG